VPDLKVSQRPSETLRGTL